MGMKGVDRNSTTEAICNLIDDFDLVVIRIPHQLDWRGRCYWRFESCFTRMEFSISG